MVGGTVTPTATTEPAGVVVVVAVVAVVVVGVVVVLGVVVAFLFPVLCMPTFTQIIPTASLSSFAVRALQHKHENLSKNESKTNEVVVLRSFMRSRKSLNFIGFFDINTQVSCLLGII